MPAKPKTPPPSKRHANLRTSADLIPDPENPREIEDENLEGLQVSMAEFGDLSGIVFNSRTGQLVAGHQRMSGIRKKFGDLPIEREGERAWIRIPGGKIFAIRLVDWDAPTQRAANIAANNPYIAGHFTDSLRPQLEEIRARNQALFDSLRLAPMVMPARGMDTGAARATLGEKFLVPPFSVLDSRQGYWQDRKRAWKGLGIQSEVGRGENLLKHNENLVADRMRPKGSSRAGLTFGSGLQGREGLSGTSIFDPVLTEILYKWFCPGPGATIIDPFAGGSVRGIVAGFLGYRYLGMDLRAEQVAANQAQARKMKLANAPSWHIGDSQGIAKTFAGEAADFIFSCPPYFDLEKYSDTPGDLSNMEWEAFAKAYTQIIAASLSLLKPDRFACFVVGDIRDKSGYYRNFVDLTKACFISAGARLYNEIILVNSIGTLPLRVGRQFSGFRKVGKCHQNVLVFFNGNPARISEIFEEIEIDDLSAFAGDEDE